MLSSSKLSMHFTACNMSQFVVFLIAIFVYLDAVDIMNQPFKLLMVGTWEGKPKLNLYCVPSMFATLLIVFSFLLFSLFSFFVILLQVMD